MLALEVKHQLPAIVFCACCSVMTCCTHNLQHASPFAMRRTCKEVRCKKMSFADGYGQWLDRKDACYSERASVVVMITGGCCQGPLNAGGN